MKTKNVIQEKSFAFAVRVVHLSRHLEEKNSTILARQVLRSGTAIGSNVEEAIGGLTRKEFAQRLGIAYKESRETSYWIKILKETGTLECKLALSLIKDCDELIRMIGSAQKTIKAKDQASKEKGIKPNMSSSPNS